MAKWQNRLNNIANALKRMRGAYKYRELIEERTNENEQKATKETFKKSIKMGNS